MDALILAAGYGTRLRPLTNDKPKAMIKIHGVPILERSLHVLKNIGVKKVVIVIGYKGEVIKKYLGNIWNGIKIVYKKTDWRGDGILKSYIKGKDVIKNRFIFLCGDTIPEEKSLRLALEKKGDIVVSVRNLKDDSVVAKVLKSGIVKNIGMRKDMKKFDKTVAGISVNEPVFFDAVESCIKNNKFDRPDAIEWMIKKGYKVNSFDISNDTFLEIDDFEDLKKAKKLILDKAVTKKTEKEDLTFVLQYLNIPITKRLAGFVSRTKITPNQITIVGLFIFLLASGLFFSQKFLIGGILAFFARMLDSIDGKVARLKFKETKRGGSLENVVDTSSDVFIIIGLTSGLYFLYNSIGVLVLGALTIILKLGIRVIDIHLTRNYGILHMPNFLKVWCDRYLVYSIIMVTGIIGIPLVGLIYFSSVYIFLLFLRIYQFLKVLQYSAKNFHPNS